MHYQFVPVESCNMCGAGRAKHRMLGMRLNRSQGRNPRSVPGIAVAVMQCTVCDLIFSDPQPIPGSLADHYGTPAESYWNSQYFEYNPEYFAHEISVAKSLLGDL